MVLKQLHPDEGVAGTLVITCSLHRLTFLITVLTSADSNGFSQIYDYTDHKLVLHRRGLYQQSQATCAGIWREWTSSTHCEHLPSENLSPYSIIWTSQVLWHDKIDTSDVWCSVFHPHNCANNWALHVQSGCISSSIICCIVHHLNS